jgi:hypothetical protein
MSPKKRATRARRHHHVYVIKLDGAVLNHGKFREANPNHHPLKACVYVGMTGLSPAERFAQHKRGYKSGKYAHAYGEKLLPHLYERYNPMTFDEASEREEWLAARLRAQGFAVWQH